MTTKEKYDLFNPPPDGEIIGQLNTLADPLKGIQGLTYIPEFIDRYEEQTLLSEINSQPWLDDLKRRVQHYGWKYDYRARSIDYSMYLGKLPEWMLAITEKLSANQLISRCDQVIINEYNPGQGIANHVDCEPCFGDTIISLSLSSKCVMDFINIRSKQKVELLLENRSLVVIKGDSRYLWSHGIPARQSDVVGGKRENRRLRISMTFREVVLK